MASCRSIGMPSSAGGEETRSTPSSTRSLQLCSSSSTICAATSTKTARRAPTRQRDGRTNAAAAANGDAREPRSTLKPAAWQRAWPRARQDGARHKVKPPDQVESQRGRHGSRAVGPSRTDPARYCATLDTIRESETTQEEQFSPSRANHGCYPARGRGSGGRDSLPDASH